MIYDFSVGFITFLATSSIDDLETFSAEPFSQLLFWLIEDLMQLTENQTYQDLKAIIEEKYEKFRSRAIRMLAIGDPSLGFQNFPGY